MRGVAFQGNSVAEVVDFPDVDPGPEQLASLIDVVAVRNAYGSQVDSFSARAESSLVDLECVFIRAPQLRRPGADVSRWAGELGETRYW